MLLNFKPMVLAKTMLDYFPDMYRFNRSNYEQVKKVRDKNFRRLMKYAHTVPLYKKKYKEAGIHLDDIKRFEDIEKLPIISRKDIIENFPKGVIKPGLEKYSMLVNTSGSTRNPVTYYTDPITIMKALILYVRELMHYGLNWNKSKITLIANFYEQSGPTQYFESGAQSTMGSIFSFDNFQYLNADDDLVEMIKQIDKFQPEFIGGFPGPIRHLALLKNKGYGKNVNPKAFFSSGGIIHKHEKKFVEETFNAKVYDIYGSTEGGAIAFECEEGNYHINSDYLYLEAIDKEGKAIEKGKSGKLAFTRLYGRGTPLIRYTGMGDIITLGSEPCNCGIPTDVLKEIHGRTKETLVLPDKSLVFPKQIHECVGEVIYSLKASKVSRAQIVQEAFDKLEILVIIDEEQRNAPPSDEMLFKKFKSNFEKLVGPDVDVTVKEVKKLRGEDENEASTPGVLTKVHPEKYI